MHTFDFATSKGFQQICYGVISLQGGNYEHYFTKPKGSEVADGAIHPVKLLKMLFRLIELSEKDYLVGWGSLGFDLKTLHTESEGKEETYRLAFNHYDLFFSVLAETGVWVSINEVAQHQGIILSPHIGKETANLWGSENLEKQRMVMRHHLTITEVIFKAWADVANTGRLHWVDSKSGRLQQASIPMKPCGYYLEPLLKLPKKSLHANVLKQMEWLYDYHQSYHNQGVPSTLQQETDPVYQILSGGGSA